MPIYIEQGNFIDTFGNVTPFYVSDAGDKITLQFELRSAIRMTSVGNPLTLDPSLNQVMSPSTNWITEGFRVLDWVMIRRHSSGGPILPGPNGQFWSQISYVDDILCDFGAMPAWYNLQNDEFITMYVVTGPGSSTLKGRDDLDVLFNHVKNGNPGSEFSLIDSEVSRIQFQGVAALPVAGIVNGILLGNQSGGFVESGTLERQPNDADGWLHHRLRIDFANPGIYDDNWFFSSECLKIYAKLLWARIAGEPFARAEAIYNLQANTGGFNEPHNSSLSNAVLISGTNDLDYCVPTTFNIVVEGPLLNIGLGAGYRSIDDTYYKNKLQSQFVFSMLISTDLVANFFGGISSPQNPTGAGYDLTVNSVTVGGSITDVSVTFTPNAAFTAFMENVDDGDRLFYLWIKCGNLNLLAFEGQLTCAPPVGGPLPMITDWGYLDHSENIQTANGILTGYEADTEDDLAYFGTFLMDKGGNYSSFSAKIEAFDLITGEDFTLQIATFGLGGVQISGAGVYLLNETQTINSTLPNTSVKRNARLELEPSLDTPTQFGVKIYFPFLLDWKYWLQQLNASVDFYPTQNKNWEQYDNLGNWILRTELVLIKDGLAYVHDNQILDFEYNANVNINSEIDLFIENPLQLVNVIPTNEIMLIRATHTNLTGNWGAQTWGMLTVEPYESAPRYICSSTLPFDNNTSNPLESLTGNVINIQFPALNVAVLECRFNSALINLNNGVKITAKIKDSGPAYEYPITILKEAELAYSVKYKLSPDLIYSGPIMQVQRDTDGAISDIPFAGAVLDEAFLLNFVTNGGVFAENRGYITKLYDQSGWNNHAITLIPTDRATIVIGGVVNLGANGYAAGFADGTLNKYKLTNQVPAAANFAYFSVWDRTATGTNNIGLSAETTSPITVFQPAATNRITEFMGAVANVWSSPASDTATGNFLFTLYRSAPSFSMVMNRNGVAMPLSPIVVPPVGGFFDQLLQRTTPLFVNDQPFQEFILYNNDQTANIVNLENNIKTRYNIP